ncbi:hypothetical protein [Micromonospora sp. WMMD1082]|uniref:hypothetical protein n=1 Tax=Micromonospora sp. WMMD1082 TaxID=3016104 RepID=UPI002415CF25|nr:hypothetical protein [Micromonospora sp. WMMD1082]MDG4794424.1 hypothetical protein [Micromonospora sp. WMMD1082]
MIKGEYAGQLVGEMTRYLSSRPGWTSTLWTSSTTALVEELLLAGAQVKQSVLSGSSFEELKPQVLEQVKADPGLGDPSLRGSLLRKLPRNADEFGPSSHRFRAFAALVPQWKASYLANWRREFQRPGYADAVAPDPRTRVTPPESAGLLAAFLLDAGISAEYLVRWLDYRAKHTTAEIDLDGFLAQLITLYDTGRGWAEIMVVLERAASPDSLATDGWMSAAEVRAWFEANGFRPPPRVHGGILYRSEQWDIYGALRQVAAALHRITNRANLRSGRPPQLYRLAWIRGVRDPRRIPPATDMQSRIPGYHLERPELGPFSSDNRLEVAIEFIQSASLVVGAAVAGMLWAAIEVLFATPGDAGKVEAASRAADIATIAFIRSDLQNSVGMLLSRCKDDPLAGELLATEGNARIARLEEALRAGEHQQLSHSAVRLHLAHTARLLDPAHVKLLRDRLNRSLRALYRQRNLVLHGGVTDGPLLESVLRTAYPVVTSVINRYTRVAGDGYLDPQVFAFDCYLRVEEHLASPGSVLRFFR